MRRKIGVGILFSAAVILAAILVPRTDGSEVALAAERALDHVIEGNYSGAAEYVYFFDGPTDVEPTISQEYGMEKWVGRLQALEEKGTVIVDYDNLQVEGDDGILKGTVDLVVETEGKQTVKEDVQLMFAKKSDGWKLQNVEHLSVEEVEGWEQALSGYVPSS